MAPGLYVNDFFDKYLKSLHNNSSLLSETMANAGFLNENNSTSSTDMFTNTTDSSISKNNSVPVSVSSTTISSLILDTTMSLIQTAATGVKCLMNSTSTTEIPLASSGNDTGYPLPTWEVVLKVVPLATIIFVIVFGNFLVILAVMTQRALRTPPNMLIGSLALADLTVGVFILPLNVIEMITGDWHFGKALCQIWLTSDVTLCSTSILHISAIAVDRYRSINEGISYISQRTIRTAVSISVCLWVMALWIASAPVLGWNDWYKKPKDVCMLPENLGYIVHSATGAFFLPAIVMVAVYIKIFFKIKERFRDRAKLSTVNTEPSQEDSSELTEDEKRKTNKKKYSQQISEILKTKMKFSLTKERKAAQTLGIIIGAFVICWTPFTLTYLTNGICLYMEWETVNIHVFRFVTWLGYVNSALNPIIYTLYNQEFRRAFIKLLRLGERSPFRRPFTISRA